MDYITWNPVVDSLSLYIYIYKYCMVENSTEIYSKGNARGVTLEDLLGILNTGVTHLLVEMIESCNKATAIYKVTTYYT